MPVGQNAPVIIKKIKKGGHGHHGGAWKVAYADFVTAMMAFFLLLWLLNAVTEEQLEGISDYFAPAAASRNTSGAGDILGGTVVSEEGSMPNKTSRPNVTVDLPPPRAGTGGEDAGGEETAAKKESEEAAEETPKSPEQEEQEKKEATAEELKKAEEQQFEKAEADLKQAIQSVPELQQLAQSLVIDNTQEGLRIQIVDQEGLAMFPRGSARMFEHTRRLLELVSKVVTAMPQKIAISGHTDATKYSTGAKYTNWELSADRANASRRGLLALGLPPERIARVVGRAEVEPFLANDPTDPRNRRISIVLLRGTGVEGENAGKSGDVEGEPKPDASVPASNGVALPKTNGVTEPK